VRKFENFVSKRSCYGPSLANRLWKLVRLPYRALLKRTLKMTRRYTLGKRDRLSASAILRLGTNWVPAEDARARLQEREARMAADNRTEAEKWLGDPPAHRSALAKSSQQDPTPR